MPRYVSEEEVITLRCFISLQSFQRGAFISVNYSSNPRQEVISCYQILSLLDLNMKDKMRFKCIQKEFARRETDKGSIKNNKTVIMSLITSLRSCFFYRMMNHVDKMLYKSVVFMNLNK